MKTSNNEIVAHWKLVEINIINILDFSDNLKFPILLQNFNFVE